MKGTFANVVHNRKHTVQFNVLSTPDGSGYLVTRQAPLECPATVESFLIERYNGSWSACRAAAIDCARDLARKEEA